MLQADLIIIGAGLAGLTAATAARARGLSTAVFDKGRGPGGRMSTRREGPFDHGAQYFTARSAEFRAVVEAWAKAGLVARWPVRLGVFDEDGLRAKPDEETRWVGTPTMRAPLAALAGRAQVRFETRVTQLTRPGQRFVAHDAQGPLVQAPRCLVALPAPQAAALVEAVSPQLAARAAKVQMAPCWAVMAELEAVSPVPFDGIFVNEGPLRWLAADHSKPGRPPGARWVLHASPTWSTQHLERAPDAVTAALVDAFAHVIGAPIQPRRATAHRWRYALGHTEAAPGSAMTAPDCPGLALAGDWCAGGRVQGAFESGQASVEVLY